MNEQSEDANEVQRSGTWFGFKVAAILGTIAGGAVFAWYALIALGVDIVVPTVYSVFGLINIFGPLLFSALLALIYWELYEVQRSETEIMNDQSAIQKRQQQIEAQQLRPYVVVEDTHDMTGERKKLTTVSNFGLAPATDVSLEVRMINDGTVYTIGHRRLRRNEDGYEGYLGLGDFLKPGEEYVQFHVRYPKLRWSRLQDEYDGKITIYSGMKYTDITEREYFNEFQQAEIDPQFEPTYREISWDHARDFIPS